MVKRMNSSLRQEENKTILREPVKPGTAGSAVNYEELLYDGNGGWLSPDWFTKKPNYEACVKFCERRNIKEEYCPCDDIFNGGK